MRMRRRLVKLFLVFEERLGEVLDGAPFSSAAQRTATPDGRVCLNHENLGDEYARIVDISRRDKRLNQGRIKVDTPESSTLKGECA